VFICILLYSTTKTHHVCYNNNFDLIHITNELVQTTVTPVYKEGITFKSQKNWKRKKTKALSKKAPMKVVKNLFCLVRAVAKKCMQG